MTERNKTVIMSDIHISNGADYAWFVDPYPEYLLGMLSDVASDSTVSELVLLGDTFDLWLYPVDVVPWTVSQILQANSAIQDALLSCVANIPSVFYINGNHDLKVTQEDLQPLESQGRP